MSPNLAIWVQIFLFLLPFLPCFLSRSKGKSKVLRSESMATYHGFSRSTHMTFRNPQTRCRTISMGNFATMLVELLFFMNRIFSASSSLGFHRAKAMDEESPTSYESKMSSICQDGNLQGTALQHLAPKLRTRCISWVDFFLGQKSKTTKWGDILKFHVYNFRNAYNCMRNLQVDSEFKTGSGWVLSHAGQTIAWSHKKPQTAWAVGSQCTRGSSSCGAVTDEVLDIIATAAAGPSMYVCIEELTRSSYKNFLSASQEN